MNTAASGIDIEQVLANYRERADQALLQFLPALDQTGTTLESAMHYAALNGGKRVRPMLVYATGHALNTQQSILDGPACAIELMHAYSLVHDDLPAMDDDDLRRGNPTCHIRYGEAMAILAGDALQALAFTTLAVSLQNQLPADTIIAMINELGHASGVRGMAAGQAIDLQAVGRQLSLSDLEQMHNRKTGALISASVVLGAMCSERPDDQIISKLRNYGEAVGPVVPDCRRHPRRGRRHAGAGQKPGRRYRTEQTHFPSILGLDGARQHAQLQRDKALDALTGLGPEFDELRSLAQYVISRSN